MVAHRPHDRNRVAHVLPCAASHVREVEMKVGVTGTRHGLSDPQRNNLSTWLSTRDVSELHHGQCVGADEAAHELALEMGYHVVIHPPTVASLTFALEEGDWELLEPEQYLVRNQAIVNSVDMMLVLPHPTLRSRGTWYTYNLAKRKGVPCVVFYGDGGTVLDSVPRTG